MKSTNLILFVPLISLLMILSSTYVYAGDCSVSGIVFYPNASRANGATILINNSSPGYNCSTTTVGGSPWGDGYYTCPFTCDSNSYSTVRANDSVLVGYNTGRHTSYDIWINVTIHEWNDPIASFGTNVPDGNVTNQTTMTFDTKCSDDVEVDTLRIYGSWGGGGWKATNSTPENDTYWNVSISGVSSGTWYVWCNDTSGNTDQTGTRSLTVDTSTADVTLNSPADDATLTSSDDTQSISLEWTPHNFDTDVNCSLYIDDTLNITKACTSGTRCSQSRTFQQDSTGITYEWHVNCSDGSKTATSATRSFTAKKKSSGGGGGGGGGTGSCGDGYCNKSSAKYTFNCYAEDYASLTNISLYGNWNNWGLVDTETVSGNSANVTFSIDFNNTASYIWNCYVCTSTGCEWLMNNQTIDVTATGGGENQQNCCQDCGCPAGQTCQNNACVTQNATNCGNGRCQPELGENCGTCGLDCSCKNGLLCLGNLCVGCGDGLCSRPQENATSCPADCKVVCGDNICEGNETFKTCCVDCSCPKGEKCINNSCKKTNFPWWILFVLLGILLAVIAYLIIKSIINKKNLMWLVLSIGKEIDKKKFNEIQKKSKGKKMDYEKENMKIEKYIGLGLGICKKMLKESIEKEEIQALKKFVEKKKELLHNTTVLFEDYRKVIRKERLAFEEDLKEILFSEEIPKYNDLKKEVISLNSVIRQIKALKVTSFRGAEE